jgi:hypothetical protein
MTGARDVIPNNNWPGGCHRAKEDAEAQRNLLTWARRNNLRYAEHGRCLHWLAKGRCAADYCDLCYGRFDWLDHATGWTRDGKPYVLLGQPYSLSIEGLREIIACADQFNLNISINGRDWYGHGTIAIELRRQDGKPWYV